MKQTINHHYDVVVVGGGPAGAATAVFLAQSGHHVLLLARKAPPGDKVGESLSPQANNVLKQLGIWDDFISDSHLPCYGNQSAWGSSELAFHDFINSPNGPGWHIDRGLFEQTLLERARGVNVHITMSNMLRRANWHGTHWELMISGVSHSVKSRFMVDATGRSSWLARRQGIERIHSDKQVSLIAFLETEGEPMADSTSLVEAVENGWWYSARIPNGRLVTTFMTDIDLHPQQQVSRPDGWLSMLNKTRYTARRIHQHGYQLATTPYFVAAGSSRLEQFWGKGWLAVGDAAMSYDPLSAHGITLALVGGRDAADAITNELHGDANALTSYGDQLDWAYSYYALIRDRYYRSEGRWLNAPYWHRRNRKTAVFAA